MLKIKAPISLVTHEDFLSDQDNFNERIRMNYGIIHSGITEEDLLHVSTTPPQLFLGEGGVTNLVSQMNVENTQVQKVDIINNFLNRIMISADTELTYQDRVYITSVLHQLGIHDDKTFMNQVFRLQEETENTVNLVNLYWNNMNELREMVEEYREETNQTIQNVEAAAPAEELSLYQNIYNRLQTGAIYQILQNYHRNEAGSRTVTNNEYRVIEQGRIAQNMLLQRLENIARYENTPLIYRRENIYEGDQTEQTEINETTINRQLTSATLLDMVDNLFTARYESTNHNVKNWYSFEDTFYGSSENTIQRIANNTDLIQFFHETNKQETSVSELRKQESTMLLQLLENRRYEDSYIEEILNAGNTENRISAETRNEAYLEYLQENRNVEERAGDTNVEVQQFLQQVIDDRKTLQQDITNRADQFRTETLHREEIRRDGDTVIHEGDEIEQVEQRAGDRNVEVKQLLQQVIEDHKLIRQDVTNQTDQSRSETVIREETRQDGDTIIHEGDEFERSETTLREENLTFEERNLKQENYQEIAQNVDQIYQQNLLRRQEYLMNIERMAQQERQKGREVGGRKKTMERSLEALTNPQEFMESFREEAEAAREREDRVRQEAAKILPADRAASLELIRQYIENPERVEMMHLLERTSEAQLMSEVFNVEHDRSERIRERTEEEKLTDHVTDRITERVIENVKQQGREVVPETESVRRVHMIHRDINNTIDEDIAEELLEQRHLLEETNRRIEKSVKNEETHSTRIVNTVNDQVVQEAPRPEQIARMIDQGIKAQVETISDKVYNKLERRLSNEKIRRGF